MDPTDNPTPFNARNPCWSCLEGKTDACEWNDVEDEVITAGNEFYDHAVFDLEGLNHDQQTKQENHARKATHHYLYTYYHHQFVGGPGRTSLPTCIEAKIKEAFPSMDGVYVGYKEGQKEGSTKKN